MTIKTLYEAPVAKIIDVRVKGILCDSIHGPNNVSAARRGYGEVDEI